MASGDEGEVDLYADLGGVEAADPSEEVRIGSPCLSFCVCVCMCV